MAEKIRRNLMLREYDIKETPAGKQTTFSIKFIKTNGEIVFMPNATATMTVVKEVPANGKSAKIEEAVAEVVKEEVKAPVPEPVIKPVPVLSLEQKLEKIDELNRIIAKYQRLQEARKNLNTF